ncbi:MAG: hypothetical protein AAFX05_04580, partial [Planctomycetota bacterium]
MNLDVRRRHAFVTTPAAVLLALAGAALADEEHPPIIQYFEATSNTQEYRMPDVFRSFYGAVWMPSPSV